MDNFKKNYQEKFESEFIQFFFLCRGSDQKIIISHNAKKHLPDVTRLAIVALTFGYKKLFLRIIASVQKYIKKLLDESEKLKGNFAVVDEWVTEFIENIENEEARTILADFWRKRKIPLARDDFNVGMLLKNF